QQERADVLSHRVVGKKRADREPVAHPVLARCAVDAQNLLHGVLLACGRRPRDTAKVGPQCCIRQPAWLILSVLCLERWGISCRTSMTCTTLRKSSSTRASR